MPAYATTITVTNTNDSGPGSLRQALADVQNGDTIVFKLGGAATIPLTSGELVINKNITISGPGADLLAVSRAANAAPFRIFHVMLGHSVIIEGLTISNGSVLNTFGGGIYNFESALTVINCTLAGNSALGQQGSGGGIFSNGGGGGGNASLIVINSAFTGNAATTGGAVANNGSSGTANLTISNSTLSGNSASFVGGGVDDHTASGTATVTITNSTLSENTSVNISMFKQGLLNIGNTVLKAAVSGVNLEIAKLAAVTSRGYNVSSDDAGGFLTGPGDEINTDPMLGPFQDNGGPTFTHALLPGSPGIDAGDPNFSPPPFFDQRGPGFDRVVNGRIDKGSFEVQGPTSTPTPTPTATPPESCTVKEMNLCGSVVSTAPTDFIVQMSCPVDNVQPSGFLVNNMGANSFTVSNFVITFHFNTSPAAPGLNTIHILPDAITCCIRPSNEFNCTFSYVAPTPSATSTATPTPTARPTPTVRPNLTPRSRPTPPPRP